MKYFPLIWAGLWRKPVRTTFTILSLVFAFVLFGLLQGITTGFDALVAASRMDHLYVNSRFGAPMPYAYKEQIAQLPGVSRVTAQAFFNGYYKDPKVGFFTGAADDGFFDYFSEFDTTPAQIEALKNTRNGVIISQQFADRLVDVKVGDRVPITSKIAKTDGSTDWVFEIVAIVDIPGFPRTAGVSAGNYDYFNEERANGKNLVNQILVIANDPEKAVETAKAIDALFINSSAPTRTAVERIAREAGAGDNNIAFMVNAIVLASLFALLLLTSNTMMQSFRERTPEFATLKAVGFSNGTVLWVILGEALIQCIGGAAVGLALARIAAPFVKKAIPGPTGLMYVPMTLIGAGIVVGVAVALVSAALPAWRANRMQVVDALAGR